MRCWGADLTFAREAGGPEVLTTTPPMPRGTRNKESADADLTVLRPWAPFMLPALVFKFRVIWGAA
jgi:hypothetical protein